MRIRSSDTPLENTHTQFTPVSFVIEYLFIFFFFNNSTGKQLLLAQAFTNFHNLRRQGTEKAM